MRKTVLALLACLFVAAACATADDDSTPRVVAGSPDEPENTLESPSNGPTSIVQLGDSIASGEGTYYGYRYNSQKQSWEGGDLNVTWDPPYNDCHDAQFAYVYRVAEYFRPVTQDLGLETMVTQFACSGATFANGISTPQTDNKMPVRPAQFGNWDTQANLNADYDAANPDLVLVTMGADDVKFHEILVYCITNAIAHTFTSVALQCTSETPGVAIEEDFIKFLPTLRKNYGTLVDWIDKRAKAKDVHVPKVVFTNYVDPFPPGGGPGNCQDLNFLFAEQVEYLSSLIKEMNDAIVTTINGLKEAHPNVGVADISGAYTPSGEDHRWCTPDPWVYGLSIYAAGNFSSLAPLHPTPDGQNSIALHVIPTIVELFPPAPPPTTTTSTSTTTSSTTTSSPTPATDPDG